MFRRFTQKLEEMRRLIEDSRSASVSTSAPQYLLAVSGGMDSMCMADLFLQACGADSFAIAHCNFSLRGEESDGDEALVREWTERNDVRLFVKRFDTVSYARENGISIEMAARDLRYGWFAQLCQEHGFAALSVAHNANDNAETLLLNLLRGTGLKGLHGMADVSSLSVGDGGVDRWSELAFSHPRVVGGDHWRPLSARAYDKNVVLCRPLLEFTRKQIEGYVLTHRVPYRHDSSNFTSDYKRNRIRNEVFPIFEKINPSFVRTLNREIGYFSEAEEIVSDWCAAQIPRVSAYKDDTCLSSGVTILLSRLLAIPHWRYLLYHILESYGFSSQVLSSLEDLLTSDRTVSGKRFESATHVLLTGRDELTVLPQEDVSDAVEVSSDIMVVRGAGTYNFNGSRFSVEVIPWTEGAPLKQPAGVLVMDAGKMKFPFVCRRWRHGDWLIPLGMKGKKKVSDMFTDLKYDALAKDSAIIMVDTQTEGLAEQQHIAGLLGVRIDDRYKVTPSTTRTILRISICSA